MSKKAESRALVAAKNRLAAAEDRLLRMQVEGLKVAEKHRDEKLDAHREGWELARDAAKRQVARQVVETNLHAFEKSLVPDSVVAVAEVVNEDGGHNSLRLHVGGLRELAAAVRFLLD
jgi:hypothetical protein